MSSYSFLPYLFGFEGPVSEYHFQVIHPASYLANWPFLLRLIDRLSGPETAVSLILCLYSSEEYAATISVYVHSYSAMQVR
jgi:hypothetical protein